MFICGTAKKYERQRFSHRFGQAISEKSSRMEYQFGDDFLLQDADSVGEKTRTASGRRAGSEIAANGATDASANGGTDVRQTKARMFLSLIHI